MKPKNLAEAEKQIEDLLLQKFPDDEYVTRLRIKQYQLQCEVEMKKASIFAEMAIVQAQGALYGAAKCNN